ncbi:MAG: hypothetical protein AAB515_01160 [Patescibacteria group bacterium]
MPVVAHAQLTSPVPVVTGSQYGNTDTLGVRSSVATDEDAFAWSSDVSQNRRMVYITPEGAGGRKLLVAGFVNKNVSTAGCGGNCTIHRLEFRVSENNGLTWQHALEGSTPYISIANVTTGGVSKFDYTLYVSPNEKDIWVSYVYDMEASSYEPTKPLTKSRIQKLKSQTPTTWIPDAASEPKLTCDGNNTRNCVGITGVAVQILADSTERVWGLTSRVQKNANPLFPYRELGIVYTDNFSSTPTWIASGGFVGSANTIIKTNETSPLQNGALPKVVFFPIGDKKIPGLLTIPPRRIQACRVLDTSGIPYPLGISFNTLTATESTTWGGGYQTGIVDVFPFYYNTTGGATPNCSGGTKNAYDEPGFLTPNEPLIVTTPTGAYPLSFSVASMPTGPNTSRLVFAYEGGADSVNTAYTNKLRVSNCTATVGTGLPAASSLTCNANQKNIQLGTTYTSPSIGFYEGKAWVAAKNSGNGHLALFSEKLGTAPWEWNPVDADFTTTYGVASPSTTAYIPAGTLQTGLDKIPTIWSHLDGSRVAFGANSGGATIGTSPPYSSSPILGYGWASNFGWLSLNCINKPDQDCTNLFGLGIGATAHSNTTELPDLTASGIAISPTTAKTFPIGGYAWSNLSGFLSFERRDSIYNCGGLADCSDADPYTDDNDYGNPPGAAYHNAPAATANIPTAKYDTASQHVYGWGRFINLCNYDSVALHCKDRDEGWVRLRGYYLTGAPSQNGTLTDATHVNVAPSCSIVAGQVVAIGNDYSVVSNCSGTVITLAMPLSVSSGAVTVYNVTGKEYGLDAFWTGDHYELAGWAWSSNYGWIRFNPLIFVGFAWLETLFGNVYSGGDVKLPSPENLSNVRYNECDPNDDGILEPCYVATYRIEANNAISAVQSSGTGFIGTPPTSAGEDINKGTGTCATDSVFCVLQGPVAGFLNRVVDPIPFPTVGSTTVSYRNALGKLDVGGLTNILNTAAAGYPNAVNGVKGYSGTAKFDVNRFGNMVYKTKPATYAISPEWTINELAGWKTPEWTGSTVPPVFPLNSLLAPVPNELAPLRSQVVHVQGNLTVDGAEASWGNSTGDLNTGGTINATGAGTFPTSTVAIPGASSHYPSCSGCAIVVNPGGSSEEYFSYTGYATNQFTNVKRIKACGGSCPTHTTGEKIRWVWRLPYADNGTDNIAQRVTVVVDGDLDIQYNIIAADRAKDADLSGMVAADSIRDLPTIAFIVKGNVTIAKEVNKVTGAFIVTSRDTSAGHDPDTAACPNAANYGNNCGGAFKTGNDNDAALCTVTSPTCRPLTIIGLLFARQLSFQRIGSLRENTTAAERVIADERLFLNPPPGLEDVTKALPNPTRTLP